MTLMPLSTRSTMDFNKEILEKAYQMTISDPTNPDPHLEVDVTKGEVPKWTSHSLRRCADSEARRRMVYLAVTEAEIDLYMGWNERVLKRAMQVHYAGMSIRDRMRSARITGMM